MNTGNVARGAVLGLLAAGAMSLVHRLHDDLIPKARTPATEQPDDSTVKVASAVARRLLRC